MDASTVGKKCSEVDRAYLAGLIDGDGAIMALIEPHNGKKFGFRVRIELKITQKFKEDLVFLTDLLGCGTIRNNRTTCDWVTRDQKQIMHILGLIRPYSRTKQRQIAHAVTILSISVKKKEDVIRTARLADTLSKFNVRSANRRKNYASMIQEHFSRND